VGEQNRIVATDDARKGLRAVPTIRRPDTATQSMLEGLATLHPLVLAVDSERRVIWLKDDLDIISAAAAISGAAASGAAALSDTSTLGGANEKYDSAELVGRPLTTLLRSVPSDDLGVSKPQTLKFMAEMKKFGRVSRARFDLCREHSRLQDGGPLPLEVSAFTMRDAANNPVYVCFADRHEPRVSLEQKNDELEACVRGVSHDLRSPLVSLLGFSRLLREDYRDVLDRTGLHFVNRINQAARHMEQLLHDMLELSRIGSTIQCRVHVNPTPILQQLRSELKIQLDEKSIHLILPEDPPPLICDRTRLYQLFSNLIGNAILHMDRSSAARIEVGIETVLDGWQISVCDNGKGIAHEDHQRIFLAFESACSAGTEHRSSGLGLAIVKKIVETHSGRVWVESEPGAGARFIVWLPAS